MKRNIDVLILSRFTCVLTVCRFFNTQKETKVVDLIKYTVRRFLIRLLSVQKKSYSLLSEANTPSLQKRNDKKEYARQSVFINPLQMTYLTQRILFAVVNENNRFYDGCLSSSKEEKYVTEMCGS
jgi:hypothetical protein